MKTKLLGILALCLGVAYAAQAQFRIGTTDYPTLSAAVAAVPTTGIPTTIEATMNHSMTTAVTVNSGQHIVLKSAGGIFTLKRSAALLTSLITVQNDATLLMEGMRFMGPAGSHGAGRYDPYEQWPYGRSSAHPYKCRCYADT